MITAKGDGRLWVYGSVKTFVDLPHVDSLASGTAPLPADAFALGTPARSSWRTWGRLHC
ncbi:hypothetical protein [Catellatospora citrea]|uniref:Uncharacterized protein n=1 Tax=Catellatospora citrea TaxID=53366 RepID=A0A8J3P266_9ACTN|nr:hypothetical protein [Catellatospora citrea]GIF99050.1 hypothetical protein Cci01nite_41440 [Catellatospora citrea]